MTEKFMQTTGAFCHWSNQDHLQPVQARTMPPSNPPKHDYVQDLVALHKGRSEHALHKAGDPCGSYSAALKKPDNSMPYFLQHTAALCPANVRSSS